MAGKVYRLGSGNDGNFGAIFEADQTAASRTDGWTVAKIAAGNSAEFDAGTKQASTALTSQTTTPKPASFLTGTTANAFKTPTAGTGTFATGNWGVIFAVRSTTASSQAGRIRFRVFRSVNADGSSATEITTSTQVCGTTGALSNSTDVSSQLTWASVPTFALSNEFLFFVVAWEITTASGSNSGDVVLRTGSAGLAGSNIQTANFTAGGAAIPKPRMLVRPGVAVLRAGVR